MKIRVEVEKLPPLAKRCVLMGQRISLSLLLKRDADGMEPLKADMEGLWADLVSGQYLKGDLGKLLKEQGIGVVIDYLNRAVHVIVLQEWEAGRWSPEAKIELDYPMMDARKPYGFS